MIDYATRAAVGRQIIAELGGNEFLLIEAEQATQSLVSAIDGLRRLAARCPAAVRSCQEHLASASDELVGLLIRFEDVREAAE